MARADRVLPVDLPRGASGLAGPRPAPVDRGGGALSTGPWWTGRAGQQAAVHGGPRAGAGRAQAPAARQAGPRRRIMAGRGAAAHGNPCRKHGQGRHAEAKSGVRLTLTEERRRGGGGAELEDLDGGEFR